MKRNWHLIRALLAGESLAAYSAAEIKYHIGLLGPTTGQADAATFDENLRPTLTDRGRSLLADLGTQEHLTAILAECDKKGVGPTTPIIRLVSTALRQKAAKATAAPATAP